MQSNLRVQINPGIPDAAIEHIWVSSIETTHLDVTDVNSGESPTFCAA